MKFLDYKIKPIHEYDPNDIENPYKIRHVLCITEVDEKDYPLTEVREPDC